jgi:hypothetical protein
LFPSDICVFCKIEMESTLRQTGVCLDPLTFIERVGGGWGIVVAVQNRTEINNVTCPSGWVNIGTGTKIRQGKVVLYKLNF